MTGKAVFLDTSIQIAQVIHGPETKRRISDRISNYDITVSSSVVRQEFKRRLLGEALYLLRQLNKHQSFARVMRHVTDILPPQNARKKQICLDILLTIHEGASDVELTERCRRYLRTLLTQGLNTFDAETGHILRGVGCAGLTCGVVEKSPYERYDMGSKLCSKAGSICGVVQFMRQNADALRVLLRHLQAMEGSEKTIEIQRAEQFLQNVLDDPESASKLEPCLKVGDLLIALESRGIPVFYTMNPKESKHFCRFLKQEMVVRPVNPELEDQVEPNYTDS